MNKREIVEGVTKEYVDRRIGALLDYAGKHSEYYRELKGVEDITRYPVMTKMEYNQNKDRILCDTFQEKKGQSVPLKHQRIYRGAFYSTL